jgi:Protein of unknown function (DUF1999)
MELGRSSQERDSKPLKRLNYSSMIYRIPQEADFPAMQALDLELLLLEQPKMLESTPKDRELQLRTSLPSLKFYARSEHSFAAVDDPNLELTLVLGFILAQSVWMGDKAIVLISSLRVHPDAPAGTLAGLLHAVTKSAYDGAVYEVHLASDKHLEPFAIKEGYTDTGLKRMVRILGSRSAGGGEGEA